MNVRLLFFAQSADWAGTNAASVAFPGDKATVTEILSRERRWGPIVQRRDFLRVAVNQKLSLYETEVRDGDEVAFLPPFSGG